MAPDFETFMKFGGRKIYSHSWKGMFWFDLPLALLLTFLFHHVVRDVVIDHLPPRLRGKFLVMKNFNWAAYFKKHMFIVLYSLLLGIFSHLLWDAATHLNLRYPDAITSKLKVGRFRFYILLQYSCSLFGLLYIYWFIIKMPATGPVTQQTSVAPFWISIFAGAFLLSAVVFFGIKREFETTPISILNLFIGSFFTTVFFAGIYYLFVSANSKRIP